MKRGARYSWSRIYQPQVKLIFPVAVIREVCDSLPPPTAGYHIRSHAGEEDLTPWAELLNEDGRFGAWNADTIRTNLLSVLITPDSSSLLFHGDEMVGCSCLLRNPSRRGRHALGMFMYLKPAHRGKQLAPLLTFRSLSFCVPAGRDGVLVTTDPDRSAALAIYLSYGAVPLKDSLASWIQWWRIHRRLRPTLESMERRRASDSATTPAGVEARRR